MAKQKTSRKAFATTAAAVMAATAVTPVAAFAASKTSFPDVPAGEYADAINNLVGKGIINGFDDGTFKPNDPVLREQAAKILATALKLDTTGTENYPDVSPDNWSYKYIVAVTKAGIFGGDENGNFKPFDNLTRQEAAKIIVEAFGFKGSSELTFGDKANIQSWAVPYVKTAVANGILKGDDQGNFNPNANIKRGDFALMIQRALNAVEEVKTPKVESVSAINGTITVTLEEAVKEVSVEDFTVTQSINGGEATEVTPSVAELSEDGLTVTLTVPEVEATDVNQSVVYTVNEVSAEAFIVETKAPEIVSVSAITTTNVDVTLAALDGDIENATVEVKNSKGEVVEVNPVNLKEGDTVASFDFVTAVSEADLTGTWTVDGVEYSFEDQELVEEIVKTSKGNSLVLFVQSLVDAKVNNVDSDIVDGYKTAIAEADPEVTSLAEVQAIIDAVNNEYAKVKDVIDAAMNPLSTEVKVYNALKAGFENVESDFSKDYIKATVVLANEAHKTIGALDLDNYTGSTAATYAEIQNSINRVNFFNTAKAVQKLWDPSEEPKASDVTKAKTLVEKYAEYAYQEDDEFTAGQYLQDAVKEIELITNIDKASTKSSVKSAIQKLEEFDAEMPAKYVGVSDVVVLAPYAITTSDNLDLDQDGTSGEASDDEAAGLDKIYFNLHSDNSKALFEADEDYALIDANLDAYIEKFDKTDWKDKNSRSDIIKLIKDVNAEQSTNLIKTLSEKATAYAADSGDTAKRAEFLKALRSVGAKKVVDSNNDEYINLVSSFAALDHTTDDVEDVQDLVDAANIDAVNNAATNGNGTSLVRALKVLEIKNLEVIDANKDYYLAQEDLKTDSTEADIKEAVEAANKAAAVQANVDAINNATTAEEVKAALDALSLDDYVKVPSADRIYIATEILETRDLLTKDRNVVAADGSSAQTPNRLVAEKAFYNVLELQGYLGNNVTEAVADIDFNGDDDKFDDLTSPVNKRTAILDSATGVNSITTNIPDTAGGESYEDLIVSTATLFKGLELPGFKNDGKLTSAETAKAEAFLNSAAFYTATEAEAAGKAEGDLKKPFYNVTEVLAFFE